MAVEQPIFWKSWLEAYSFIKTKHRLLHRLFQCNFSMIVIDSI